MPQQGYSIGRDNTVVVILSDGSALRLGKVLSFDSKQVTSDAKQPFSVVLDTTNNPPSRVALGYMQVDVRVTYLSVITVLLVNVEGGQSVSVNVASITPTS